MKVGRLLCSGLALLVAVGGLSGVALGGLVQDDADRARATKTIDKYLDDHWKSGRITPAPAADDAEFLRRVTLDLAGRIPTPAEVDRFLADKSGNKRLKTVERLIDGPEFPLHFGNVLDQMIQGRYSGDEAFLDYLRRNLREGTTWDDFFREIIIGPWDEERVKPASRFLDRRARNLDRLTADATRVFFGVDISCAKCHDHPLVEDWKQDHFYGMASFFNRTTGGKGKVGEKNEGEVTFLAADGKEKTARMMFLSGQFIDEPAGSEREKGGKQTRWSRREQLVKVALEDQIFLSRSFVNRMWQYFFGLGLIDPVDQIHSGSLPAVDGLLDQLAEDFAAGGYDVRRLIAAIVTSRAYGLSSKWERDEPVPADFFFAVARLRPLSRRQLAFSIVMATSGERFDAGDEITSRIEQYVGVDGLGRIEKYLALEERSQELIGAFDPRAVEFQSSTDEALFLSNNEAMQKLIRAEGENLSGRLAKMDDTRELVEAAVKTILSRPPREDELSQLAEWVGRPDVDRRRAAEQLVWALLTSAEFRFNH